VFQTEGTHSQKVHIKTDTELKTSRN